MDALVEQELGTAGRKFAMLTVTGRPPKVSKATVDSVAATLAEAPVVGQVAGNNPTKDLVGKKLYDGKEGIPPIMGGVKIGNRKIVAVTGASSGLGLWGTKSLVDKGNY